MTDFADVTEPAACLVPPGEPEDFLDPLKPLNDVVEFLSPSGWLFKLAELYLPTDPVKWAKESFAGDWKAYARCVSAWQETGRACDGVARNLRSGSARIDATWDGNAAEAAAHYFSALAGNLADFRTALDAMGVEYLVIAQSVSSAGAAVGDCLGAIVDALITLALAAAVEAASGGSAAVAAAALGTEELLTILREWERMVRIVAAAQAVMHAGHGTLVRLGTEALAGLNAFALPGASYDHPAV
ncbi:hypothetical protein FGW37_08245 [Streptomyces rectiverticillatus]|uniref:hypothetical protein n=1 Tax=Streptomyces rectiverticillatus TaxID=173860 RepID=UPI0015C2E785|nr:hypothetical protein [Streptomyces rectiverticillatus]QLE71592.1 hypothetical protein FGW37_08245 [Streptomyces rectiverticillatus]